MSNTDDIANVKTIKVQEDVNTNNSAASNSSSNILQLADAHTSAGIKVVFSKDHNNVKSETKKGENE